MPPVLQIPPGLRVRPFRGSQAVSAGKVTKDQLSSRAYRRIHRDVYVAATVPDTLSVRAHAAGLLVPSGGAVGGYAALELLLPGIAPRDAVVDLVLPRARSVTPRVGIKVRRAQLDTCDTQLLAGTRVTNPIRTAFDLARSLGVVEAVVVLDALWRVGLIDAEDIRRYTRDRHGWSGVHRVRRACDLADPGAESPMESRLRLLLVLAGLPRPVTQFEVLDERRRLIARVDLAYPELRIAIEYDGDYHGERSVRAADLRRRNALTRASWQALHYSAVDVYRTPDATVAQVRDARKGAS